MLIKKIVFISCDHCEKIMRDDDIFVLVKNNTDKTFCSFECAAKFHLSIKQRKTSDYIKDMEEKKLTEEDNDE